MEIATTIPIDAAVALTQTGMTLPDGLSIEAWTDIGRKLMLVDKSVQWALGDWWAYGESNYGERAAAVIAANGLSFQTLANYGTVARSVETSRRREVLPWSAHVEVASVSPEIQDRILDVAVENSWSVREIRSAVREFKSAGEPKPDQAPVHIVDDAENYSPQVKEPANQRQAFIDMLALSDIALNAEGIDGLIRFSRLDTRIIRSLGRRLEWLADEIDALAQVA